MEPSYIALVRHGEYEQPQDVPSAHLPHPLTERGREQAREGARTLHHYARERGVRIERVIDSSHMLRGYETARAIGDELQKLQDGPPTAHVIEEFDALAERCVGSVANLTLAEIDRVVERDPRLSPLPKKWKSDSHFRLPFQGAESLLEAGQRVADHVARRTAELNTPALKVFIGHGAAFRHAAVQMRTLELSQVRTLSMYHCRPVFFRYADGVWSHDGGEWKPRQTEPVLD